MKNLLIFLSLGFVVISSQFAAASTAFFANADDLLPIALKPENGKVVASIWSTGKPTAKFNPTDADGKPINAINYPIERRNAIETPPGKDVVNKPEQPPKPGQKHWSITYDGVPPFVQVGQADGKVDNVPLIDLSYVPYDEFGQQLSQMNFESTSKDALTGEYALQNIFGVLAADRGSDPLQIPLLFGDTNGDGEVGGPDDFLYELVDLRLFLAGTPDFSNGQSIALTGGMSSQLPSMLFSTAPFTFDSQTGFAGTPYAGASYVAGVQELNAEVPEPATLGPAAASLVLFATAVCRRKHK
jgi:hypothetical protein